MRRVMLVMIPLLWLCANAPLSAQDTVPPRAGQTIWAYGIASDPDGDPLTFTTIWWIDGVEVRRVSGFNGVLLDDGNYFWRDELPGQMTAKDNIVVVRIQAFDGAEYSVPREASVVVIGWMPVLGDVYIGTQEPLLPSEYLQPPAPPVWPTP